MTAVVTPSCAAISSSPAPPSRSSMNRRTASSGNAKSVASWPAARSARNRLSGDGDCDIDPALEHPPAHVAHTGGRTIEFREQRRGGAGPERPLQRRHVRRYLRPFPCHLVLDLQV